MILTEGIRDMTTAPNDTPTTETAPAETSPIDLVLTTARTHIAGTEYVPVSTCVDWLLDCHNAAKRPDVRHLVDTIIPQFSVGNLRSTASFEAALDEIQTAVLMADSFEDLELDSA